MYTHICINDHTAFIIYLTCIRITIDTHTCFPFTVSLWEYSCLLPVTRYPLPVTCYPLPVTRYLLPVTRYPFSVTCYMLPVTRCLLPVTCYLLPVTRYPLSVTCYMLLLPYYLSREFGWS